MRVLVDMDGILVNLLDKWLSVYNAESGEEITRNDITSFGIHDHVEAGHDIYEIIKRPGFFDDLPPLPGSVEAVLELERMGHKVLIASSPAGGDSARAKYEWVERHFKWHRRRVALLHKKHWLDADVIIDDRPETLQACAFKGMKTVTIGHPYNQEMRGVVDYFADDYTDPAKAWSNIVGWFHGQGEAGQ